MLEKVKDIPPEVVMVNGNRKQSLRNRTDSGAFTEDKIKEKMEKINV